MKLKTLKRKNVRVRTFDNNEVVKTLGFVQFYIKGINEENVLVNTFVSEICLPLHCQNIEFAKENYNHLKHVKLADSNPQNLDLEVDILIGSDLYWNFICDTVIRGDSGPVALLTKVGYVLSGPVENSLSSHSNFINAHIMKIQTECSERENLHNTMKTFWANETLGTDLIETNVFKKFNEDVELIDQRYQVKLPYKENHDVFGDNFLLSKQRLKVFKVINSP